MKDRFTNGLISGAAAGIVYAAWSLTSRFILQWSEKSVAGFGALLTFNEPPEGLLEHMWGTLVALGFAAVFGVVFVYLLLLIESDKLYLKAIVFSTAAWFLTNDVIVPRISEATDGPFTLATATSAAIGAVIFGIVLAFTYSNIVNRIARS